MAESRAMLTKRFKREINSTISRYEAALGVFQEPMKLLTHLDAMTELIEAIQIEFYKKEQDRIRRESDHE